MPHLHQHPIVDQSFAVIDREMGEHSFSKQEYAIIRRVIHTTADFEFQRLIRTAPGAIAAGIRAIQQKTPIVTDVRMVEQGAQAMVSRTFENVMMPAIAMGDAPPPGQTRSAAGMARALAHYPQAIVVVGNAPTALLAVCEAIAAGPTSPALVIGAPVGFIAVTESKQALAATDIPQIRVEGRKGGSGVAAAILNALVVMAWEALP